MERKNIKKQISKRFLEACDRIMNTKDYKSDAQLAKDLGLHVQVFSDIRNEKLQAGTDLISILLTLFPEIDAKWLLLGYDGVDAPVPNDLEEITLNRKDLEQLVEQKVKEALQQYHLQVLSAIQA